MERCRSSSREGRDLRSPRLGGSPGAPAFAGRRGRRRCQRKSPSPFGPGLCGVGGEGGGVPITAGGVQAERPPRLRVPKKIRSRKKGGKTKRPGCVPRRFADSCLSRRLSPVPDSPITYLSDSEKRREAAGTKSPAPSRHRCRFRHAVTQRLAWRADQAPVSSCGAATAFDSGDSRCLSQMERTTRTAVERNSLCQFWKLSNHSWGSPK